LPFSLWILDCSAWQNIVLWLAITIAAILLASIKIKLQTMNNAKGIGNTSGVREK